MSGSNPPPNLPPIPGNVSPSPAPPVRRSFFHQAATASLVMPFLAIVLQEILSSAYSAMPRESVRSVQTVVSTFLGFAIFLGMILGIIALFGIPRYGTKGILVRALIGILVPGLLILAAIPAVVRATEIARERAAEQGQR